MYEQCLILLCSSVVLLDNCSQFCILYESVAVFGKGRRQQRRVLTSCFVVASIDNLQNVAKPYSSCRIDGARRALVAQVARDAGIPKRKVKEGTVGSAVRTSNIGVPAVHRPGVKDDEITGVHGRFSNFRAQNKSVEVVVVGLSCRGRVGSEQKRRRSHVCRHVLQRQKDNIQGCGSLIG